MILLDAYALLAYLKDEGAADAVAGLLREGECAVTAVNLMEVLDVLERRDGWSGDDLIRVVSPLLDEAVGVLAVSEAEAWRGASLRAAHYRRRDAQLSLADCMLLAAATGGDRIATVDRPLATAARAEGAEVIALRGRGSK